MDVSVARSLIVIEWGAGDIGFSARAFGYSQDEHINLSFYLNILGRKGFIINVAVINIVRCIGIHDGWPTTKHHICATASVLIKPAAAKKY